MDDLTRQVQNMLGDGWGTMESPAEHAGVSHEAQMEQYRIDKVMFDAFSTGAGAEALDHLRAKTIEQPAFNPDIGLIGVLQGFSREGQDSLVRYIEMRMKRATDGPPAAPEPKE